MTTIREVRLTFLAFAVGALVISGALAYGIIHKVNQSDDIVGIAAANASQIDRLNDELDRQARARADADKAARVRLAAAETENRQLRRAVEAMARALRSAGLKVPRVAFTSRSGGGAGVSSGSKSGTTTASKAVDQPGHSDSHRTKPKP